MNIIRMTAFIAVTIISFACDSGNKSQNTEEIKTISSKYEMPVSDKKKEAERITDQEEFYTDTAGKQIPGDAQHPADKQKQTHQQPPAIKPDWNKKIIKTASLNVEVKDYYTFYSSLREKIKGLDGYIAQEEQSQSDYKIENSLIIKVPVDQFDNAVVQLTGKTEKISQKKITSQDVTTEVIDTKSRMESKKQVRLRYIDMLKQAKNMEEILSVQSEINGIQEQIESAAGRIEYLGHSSTFSTINLTYYQVLNSSAKDTDKPSFSTKLSSAFSTGWSWVGDLFVGLVSIWPLFLLAFIALIVYKRTRLQKPKQA